MQIFKFFIFLASFTCKMYELITSDMWLQTWNGGWLVSFTSRLWLLALWCWHQHSAGNFITFFLHASSVIILINHVLDNSCLSQSDHICLFHSWCNITLYEICAKLRLHICNGFEDKGDGLSYFSRLVLVYLLDGLPVAGLACLMWLWMPACFLRIANWKPILLLRFLFSLSSSPVPLHQELGDSSFYQFSVRF